ncbi:MAG: nitrogenase component 1 [Clostridiales bacterium]
MENLRGAEQSESCLAIADAAFPNPFVSGLEYGAPARGPWNIVHLGMLIPESHQIFVCAQGCLRGVVLTAAELGALNRFSTVTIEESNVLVGNMEELLIEGVSDIIREMEQKPRAILVFTSCIHHFIACDLGLAYRELRRRFPTIDFTDCYMTPILRKSGLSPDVMMRKQLYSLLQPLPQLSQQVNIIGNATPLAESCDLKQLLSAGGYDCRELPLCHTYDQYLQMAQSRVNITTIPTAQAAGEDLAARLGQTHLYLPFSYDFTQISHSLKQLAQVLNLPLLDDVSAQSAAMAALAEAQAVVGEMPIVIDYTATTRPLGLGRLLLEQGFVVTKIYADGFNEEEKADFMWLQAHHSELEISATVHHQLGGLPRKTGAVLSGKLLAIDQKAAYFSGTKHFVNLVEGGGLWGFDGIIALARLMIDAVGREQDTKEIIQIKGWGCCG